VTVAIDDDAALRRLLRVPWMVWGGLLCSLPLYVVVAFVALPVGRPPRTDVIAYVLCALAASLVIAAPVVRARLGPPRADLGPDVIALERAQAVLGRYFVAQVVASAMCDAAGIFGLLASFFVWDPRYAIAGAAAAAAGMVVLRPSTERLRSMLRAAAQAPVDPG
jgi:hypothetical protein